jgi:hypothetical protein
MLDLRSSRLLRTPHSERHLIFANEVEVAGLDLHYLLDGRIAGTLTVIDDSIVKEADIEHILRYIDTDLLPEVCMDDGDLCFTVVVGRVLGSFTSNLSTKRDKKIRK